MTPALMQKEALPLSRISSLPASFLETQIPKRSKYIPHTPTDQQSTFLWLNCREAFYGGAAGCGKSDALLMAALQYVHVPGYSALLLRRTFADLNKAGALLDRAREWLINTDAVWKDREKSWVFPSGARLAFGYLDTEQDKYQYQSAEYQYIGFDELTQFTMTQYLYLFSRLRRVKGIDVPLRMRSASNPGGLGHEWVRARFITEESTDARQFVPAKLDDNPYLDRDEYIASLNELDPVTRAQLLHGDWETLPEGEMFRRAWLQVVDEPRKYDQRGMKLVRFWDLAGAEPTAENKDPDYTVGVLMGLSREGIYYVWDVQRDRLSPGKVEALIKHTAEIDGKGVAIWMEQEPGSSGVNTIHHYRNNVLPGYDFRGERATGSKAERAGPLSSMAEGGQVQLIRAPWNRQYVDELVVFPGKDFHDDQVDASSGAFAKLTAQSSYKPGTIQPVGGSYY